VPATGPRAVPRADRGALELLPLGLVAFDIWQARDAVPLQAPVQSRPYQVRDRGLESIETIIQRQQRVPSEGDDRRLLFLGQDRRPRFLRPCLHVFDRGPLPPLRDGLLIDAQFTAQLRKRSLRSFGPSLTPMAGWPSLLPLGRRAWSWSSRDEPVP
jgi:hypothetical protein